MGAFVSIPDCKSHYDIILNCSVLDGYGHNVKFNGTWPEDVSFGSYKKGQFPGDPDIAGIGILGVFVAVTSFALAASIFDVLWKAAKTFKWKSQKPLRNRRNRVSFSDILETLVVACSDQQLFTGAAYALTLRYWRGCTVSAYHYNIVANMLLLTCATHLMSVTIVRNYWKYPWLAILRIIAISGVFVVTGLLFTNQNAVDRRFPTGIPAADETNSLIFLPAACFESDKNTATATFQDSVRNSGAFFGKTLRQSTPDNKIQGWNWYVLSLLYYGFAIVAEIIRFFRRAKSRKGWRGDVGRKVGRYCRLGTVRRKLVSYVFLAYLLGGAVVSAGVVFTSSQYIFELRAWVDRSGWIQRENNQNPENDGTSFGQLVPILTSALILFSFVQIISEKVTKHSNQKHEDEEAPPQDGTIQYLDPSSYDLLSPSAQDPEKTTTAYFGAAGVHAADSPPPRIELEHQSSWESSISLPSAKPEVAKLSSPTLGTTTDITETMATTMTTITTTTEPTVTPASASKTRAPPPTPPRSGRGSGYTALLTEPELAAFSPSPLQSQPRGPHLSRTSLCASAGVHVGTSNEPVREHS